MSILQLLATGTLFSNVGHRPHCHSFRQAFAQCEVQAVKGVQIENCRAGVQLQGGACSCVALFAKVKKKKNQRGWQHFLQHGSEESLQEPVGSLHTRYADLSSTWLWFEKIIALAYSFIVYVHGLWCAYQGQRTTQSLGIRSSSLRAGTFIF